MADMRRCSLCGYEFDAEGMACHTSCPLSSGCHIVCCPNCGYQIPDQAQMPLTSALQKLWERYKQAHSRVNPGLPCTVCDLYPGQCGEVTEIRSLDRKRLARLSAYGLMPGCQICLRQRSPAYVLLVDETEVALDHAVAREIQVRVTE